MWSLSDMPSQAGRRAVVTGTGGLGYETALALAAAGASIVIAGRSPRKGREAVVRILNLHSGIHVVFEPIDLASLASIADFAGRMEAVGEPIDLLVNNAGVMAPPRRQTTADGFELQFGVNHLGHFALTGRLLPLLRKGNRPRVVGVSSAAHFAGRLDFGDLQQARRYRPTAAYGASKLANLLFAFELQRRSDAAGWGIVSCAAHPGFARTELIANGPGADSLAARLGSALIAPWGSQSAADGALPVLYAATSPDAGPASYWGPGRLLGLKGPPAAAPTSHGARDPQLARRLWEVSEDLTGVRFGA
jgi:NAD(P)-dependent dehydrogenase (short-subunit alcohol dehydrogenase family)